MADPEADGCDVDEAQEALGGLVVTSGDTAGVFQLVEAPLDQIAQLVERTIHADAHLAGLAHRNDRKGIAGFYAFPNAVSIIAPVGEQQTHRPNRPEITRELIETWYRDRAHIKFPERIKLCLGHFPNPEAFRPKGLIVRQTRKRWGSMSPAGRLLLNRRLLHAPVDAIDYVITHELCHLAEPNHGPAFFELLEKVMPDWERRKHRLERAMA